VATSLKGDVVQSLHGIGTNLSKAANIINGVLVCVLYAALPPEAQMLAFQPKPEGCVRKIILSTNIGRSRKDDCLYYMFQILLNYFLLLYWHGD